jgi:4-amino-4-deoxy-L-arabinose transferase-like glycosyltransferase
MAARTRRDTLWLTLIFLMAAFLRLYDLGRQSLWLDEAYTWYLTLPSWRDIWTVMLLISDTSPLHYVVTRLLVPLIGRSEFALRFVALVAEMIALPVMYRLGRDMFNRKVGLCASALFAFSPFAVWYARDARPYGFYLLFAALALWGFWRWAERGGRPWLFVLSSAALYLTHYAAALFALAQAGYVIADLRRRPLLFRRWFGWQTLAALPTGLYVLAFLLRRQPITGNAWIPRPGLLAPLQTLLNFLSADAVRLTVLGVLLAIAGAVALAIGLYPLGAADAREEAARRILLWWMLLPMLAVWLLSVRLAAYIDRFFFPEIIPLMVLLAAGLARLSESFPSRGTVQVASFACAFILVGGMLLSSVALYANPRYAKEDWRGVAQSVSAQALEAPLLVQDSEVILGLSPYLQHVNVEQASPEKLEAADKLTAVILRSPHESGHALSKTAPFNPLTESPLASWFVTHPNRVQRIYQFVGVSVVIVKP